MSNIINLNVSQNNQSKLASIYAPQKSDTVSGKYQFVNTAAVIQALEGQGFDMRAASQRGTGPSAKHLVRLTHSNIQVGDGNKLEVVLRNSHNGTSSLNLMLGVFRMVCSNGMVVGTPEIQPLVLRHVGEGIQQTVEEALMQIDEQRRIVAAQVELMKSTSLTNNQVQALGIQALTLAFQEGERISTTNADLITLTTRRSEDRDNQAWTVFNRIQENLLRGGVKLEGMKRQLQGVRNIDRDVYLNKGLWNLSVETAKKAA